MGSYAKRVLVERALLSPEPMIQKARISLSRARRNPSKSPRSETRIIDANDSIETFMTRSPHCIGKDQKLAVAHALMRKAGLRHLPVLEAGKLVGMVSQRDLYFVETIRGVDPGENTVEDAMTEEAYQVPPSARLHDVVGTMAKKKLGSAVVVEAGRVVGVFTTTDALKILAELVARRHVV
jgi:acetoin utilization protein AcuB